MRDLLTWDVTGRDYPLDFFGPFEPEEALYDIEGPRIFTTTSSLGDMLLAYQCGEAEDLARFLVVPADTRLVRAVRDGRMTVREALDQPWVWLLDCDGAGRLRQARKVDLASVPPGVLPHAGVVLPEPQR